MRDETPTVHSLYLPDKEAKLIREHGEHSYPEECCGFLFGVDGDKREIVEVVPVGNEQDDNRARRFLISPEQFKQAEAHAIRTGNTLLGFYHTHPDHPAIPSDFDREHALPFYSYVILSVQKGQSAEMRSWQLRPDRDGYEEETLKY